MAPQFEVAEAYADFHVNVDKGLDRAIKRLKARAKDMEVKAHLDFSADTKKVEAQLKKLGLDKIKPKIQPELDKSATDRAVRQTENAMSRVADRANAKFNALTFGALTLGLPAAAAAGVAGVGVALAGVPALFVTAAAMIQKNNAVIENSFRSTGQYAVGHLEQMSEVMVGPLLGASNQLRTSFDRLRPSINTAFERSAQLVEPLVGAVTDAAENAIPGMVESLQEARPALEGVRRFAAQAGTGLSEFFSNAAKGSQGTRQGLEIVGGTVRTLESRFGTLFANLANGSSGPLRALDVIMDKISQGLVTATSSGSAFMGALSGATNAGAGAVTVLNGVLAAVSALPPQVGQFAGSMTVASMIASRFGIDAGKGFEGLGQKVTAAKTTTDKFKTAISGLAAGAVHPAALAVAALAVGLDLLGQSQQQAAEKAAQHKADVEQLTAALREDNGVLGEHVNKVNSKALADKNAASNLATFGQTIGTATAAIQGSNQAYDKLKFSAGAALATIADQAGIVGANRDALIDLGRQSLNTGQNYGDLKDQVRLYGTAADGTNGQVQRLTDAQRSQIEALLNGTGAVAEQLNKTRESQAAYMATEHALTGLSDAQIRARDATTQHTAAIYEQMNASLGHRGAVLNTKQAVDELAKVNQNAKSTEDQKAAALLNAENAMARQITAAGQLAASNAGTVSESQRLEIQTRAQNAETIKLANSWAGPLPASLQQAISKMSATQAVAAGLKVGVDNLGRAVVTLPNGKQIVLTSTAAAEEAKVIELRNAINSLRDRNIKITVSRYGDVGAQPALGGHSIAQADGGRPVDYLRKLPRYADGTTTVRALDVTGGGQAQGPGHGRQDNLLAWISSKEMVTNARDTARNLTELYAINNGQRNYEKYPDTGRPPEAGLRAAAAEALRQVRGGGELFEDFSFRGSSANMDQHNDELTKMFYASRKPGWNFDGSERTRADITQWLEGFIGESTTKAATVAATAGVQSVTGLVAGQVKPFTPVTSTSSGNVTINVYAQPAQDVYALAMEVSRQIELRAKVA